MRKIFLCIIIISIILLGIGCDSAFEFLGFENDVPDSNYDENKLGLPGPVITDVNPKEKVYAGVTEVTVTGENFDPDSGECFIYFGGLPGEIISQAENEIVAIPPLVSGDSLEIKISKLGAYPFGVFSPYPIKLAAIEYAGIDANLNAGGMACDLNENLYFAANGEKNIYKINPSNQEKEIYIFAIPDFSYTMKMGPDTVLYFAVKKYLYTSPAGGGSFEKFNSTKAKAAITDFDFGPSLNIYAAGKEDIYLFLSDGSYTTTATYEDYLITSLRVFDGYVYISAYYTGTDLSAVKKGIWRNQINSSDATLGTNELVFDWGQYVGAYGANILTLTLNSDGDIYFSTEVSGDDALYVLRSNGSGDYTSVIPDPLYFRVLKPQYENLCWGNGIYLYANYKGSGASDQRIMRITIEEDTAPYYGRK